MSGSRAAFAELDKGVCGTVRYGDDLVARIEGCGTVVFACKNDIPQLATNIVSVGQLDVVDYDIHVKSGVMRLHELDGWLLARVPRQGNRLYILDIDIVRLVARRMPGIGMPGSVTWRPFAGWRARSWCEGCRPSSRWTSCARPTEEDAINGPSIVAGGARIGAGPRRFLWAGGAGDTKRERLLPAAGG